VYAYQQTPTNQTIPLDVPPLIDPSILQAARQAYRLFIETNSNPERLPTGVVVSRYTYKGKWVFSLRPILLPEEYFVPLNQIEASMY
jgi:hypothetical protein